MRIIPVEFIPFKVYSSPQEAIAAAKRDPRLAKATADAEKLVGTTVVDVYWTDTDHVIRFSNGLLLHVFPTGEAVDWVVTDQPPPLHEKEVEGIGAPPVTFRWSDVHGYTVDRSALAAARTGRAFKGLFGGECLWVYCQGVLAWDIHAIRDTERDRVILYVDESV